MIELEHVSCTYPGATQPVLADAHLRIAAGELVLVVGATGSGKSTLLSAISGRFPRNTGGELRGSLRVAGRDTAQHRPRDLADVVGVVGQDPQASFVASTVAEELAYTMEQLGIPPDQMRLRVDEVLGQLQLTGLRDRTLDTLSAGEQQRVAIGAVLTARPRVLLLDEPTSALDPPGAADLLATLRRLAGSGITVILAEHRIERVAQLDRVIQIAGGQVQSGSPEQILPDYSGAPPVVAVGRLLGWRPIPVTVAQAAGFARSQTWPTPPVRPAREARGMAFTATGITVRHGSALAVDNVDLTLHRGAVTALMGPNGAGKSSLLWAVYERARARGATLLPQPASDLLYLPSVAAECQASDASTAAGRTRCELDAIMPGIPGDRHPRDLSEGQRLAMALAVQLAGDPSLVLLDEPTRGLDSSAKAALSRRLRSLAQAGRAVLVATHDVEFAADCADRVVDLHAGRIASDGATADVLGRGHAAPQVTRLFPGSGMLTVSDVRARLRGSHD
ncbi:MAG: ABC transporter ATP-binding protein [Beutenbergiaceae bacterium]